VTADDTVLTQGSPGVSVFVLQFAQPLGARVIATTPTAEKAVRLKTLGATEAINYRETPDWDEKARELTKLACRLRCLGPLIKYGESRIPALRPCQEIGRAGSILSPASPAKAGVHRDAGQCIQGILLKYPREVEKWVPAFPTDLVRGLKAHGTAMRKMSPAPIGLPPHSAGKTMREIRSRGDWITVLEAG
jgi:Zinc-binding dehydrogenase